MGLREQSTDACFPGLCFLQFSEGQLLVGLRSHKQRLLSLRSSDRFEAFTKDETGGVYASQLTVDRSGLCKTVTLDIVNLALGTPLPSWYISTAR